MAEAIRNISGTIWDREIPGIVRILRAEGVSEFTISDDPSGMLDTLSVFEAHGAKLQGLTTIEGGNPAFLMKLA